MCLLMEASLTADLKPISGRELFVLLWRLSSYWEIMLVNNFNLKFSFKDYYFFTILCIYTVYSIYSYTPLYLIPTPIILPSFPSIPFPHPPLYALFCNFFSQKGVCVCVCM